MRFLLVAVVIVLGMGLTVTVGGCTSTRLAGAPVLPPSPIVTDNFCETARKREWSIHDTPQTRAEAKAWNRAVDRRCGVPGS